MCFWEIYGLRCDPYNAFRLEWGPELLVLLSYHTSSSCYVMFQGKCSYTGSAGKLRWPTLGPPPACFAEPVHDYAVLSLDLQAGCNCSVASRSNLLQNLWVLRASSLLSSAACYIGSSHRNVRSASTISSNQLSYP